MYIIEDRKEVEDFIHKVFNYYNGRINRIIPSFINIEWALYDITTMGITYTSKTVTIYPMVIAKYSKGNKHFKLNIIMSIIHELYHVNQYIEYSQMHYRKDFENSVEFPVEFMTWCYITNHEYEIATLSGGCTYNDNTLNSCISIYSAFKYGYYRIRSIDDYIFTVVDDILRSRSDYNANDFKPIFYECINKQDVSLSINDNNIIVKSNGVYNDIQEIQKFVYNNYSMYKYRENVKGCINEYDDGSIIIQLSIKSYNYMAEIYNGGNKNE